MRNLKKVLSLSLALVMLLGLMVVGAGAATTFADLKDKDEISENYAEAVDLLTALGVLEGNENDEFMPTGTLTARPRLRSWPTWPWAWTPRRSSL